MSDPGRIQRIGHWFENLGLSGMMAVFRALPPDRASALGARIGRWVGPLMRRANRIADKNLRLCFPDMAASERVALTRRMWEHFGRLLAEMPHTKALWEQSTDKGDLDAVRALRPQQNAAGRSPLVIVAAHFGNWEVGGIGAQAVFPPTGVFYRPLNNQFADALLERLRTVTGVLQFAKGKDGGRNALRHLRSGGTLCVLMDQKMREGIDVPFFGHTARTPYAAVLFALKTGAPIVPMAVRRLTGARFVLQTAEPIPVPDTGNRDEDIRLIVAAINQQIEAWIREAPEQWMWIHRRWPIDYGVRKK